VYVDEENGRGGITELLQHMGADPHTISQHFKYAEFPGLTREAVTKWKRTVEMMRPALVVFDSFADHLALDNLSENASVDVTSWMKAFAQLVKNLGGAVLILDHVAKDANGKGARGSTAKLAKVDVAWKLTVDAPFNRKRIGKVTIRGTRTARVSYRTARASRSGETVSVGSSSTESASRRRPSGRR